MQRAILAVAGLALLAWPATGQSMASVSEVVTLIQQIKNKLEADRAMEQKSYDKYACWCEKTLERKAKDIADAKARIEELGALILELTAQTSAQAVDLNQLEKEINATKAAIAEATTVRENENAEFLAEKAESEQCTGALEAAINALTGAGVQKKGFLQSVHEAQLLSIAGSVKRLISMAPVENAISPKDLQVVRRFTERPDDFMRPAGQGLLQVDKNPFGDYAPRSTQIQGILKGMYDAFTMDLEKENGEEAEKQKAFEEFLATKMKELETLEDAHLKLAQKQAEMEKQLADSKTELDDTKEQLKADEKFFEETKAACKAVAADWAERTRLRTEELMGINKAIEILTSPEAKRTFQAIRTRGGARDTEAGGAAAAPAGAMLLQVVAHPSESQLFRHRKASRNAYDKLRLVASRYGGLALAQIAAALKTGGHFDEVIVMIDKMIADLRKEGEEDIAHRDRCQVDVRKAGNDGEDLETDLKKAESELGRLKDEKAAAEKELELIEEEINQTKTEMEDRLVLRNEEVAAFKIAIKDNTDGIATIEQAIAVLTKFYQQNKLPLELVQQEPSYTIDEDKAPELKWKGDYGGSRSETGGIISILEMIKEDMQTGIETLRKDDAEAQKQYEEDMAAMKETLDAQEATQVTLQKKIAELDGKILEKTTFIDKTKKAQELNEKTAATLETDCAWVETHFDSRREKRAKEIAGLQEAKSILAGAESGGESEDLGEDLE